MANIGKLTEVDVRDLWQHELLMKKEAGNESMKE